MHQKPIPSRNISRNMTERAFLKECLSEPTEPDDLQARIMARIQRSIVRRVWTEIALSLTATVGLLGYVFFSRSTMWLEIEESSFIQLSRLAISDPDIVFSNAREASWSLIESIPLESVLFSLIFILFASCSLGFFLRLREIRRPHSFRLT